MLFRSGEIEAVRGVAVSTQIIKTLEERLNSLKEAFTGKTATREDGKTLADDHGANCYNDQVPPFWCAGLYWWRSEGDPMALRVGEWART